MRRGERKASHIIFMIRSRTLRLAWYLARMREGRSDFKILAYHSRENIKKTNGGNIGMDL